MRITLLSLWSKGGMLHYASHLANALSAQERVEVTLVVPKQASAGLLQPGVRVRRVDVPTSGGIRNLFYYLRSILRIGHFLRTIKDSNPDILHINSSHIWIAVFIRLFKRHYRVVATVHDVKLHSGEETFRKRFEKNAVFRHAEYLVTHSVLLKRLLLHNLPWRRGEEVFFTPRGPYYLFGAGNGHPQDKCPTVLFFGRILPYKGLKHLIQAAPRIRAKVPEVRFVIVGEGDISDYLPALSDTSLFEVHNRFIDDAEIATFFRRAWLVALPYTEASWSGVASTAHMFSLPIVASNVGCLPELVRDDANGLLVEPGDEAALEDAITRVLNDRALRAKFRKAARVMHPGDWDKTATSLRDFYQKVTADPSHDAQLRRR